jgi:sulfite exporter TauE/SafE
MCGGIHLSQCIGFQYDAKKWKIERCKPSFLYNAGRIISYTTIGFVIGALGSIVSLNGVARGAVALIAGMCMIIIGFNLLNIFPNLRALPIRMPQFLTRGIREKSPLTIGLLSGFMPCGPLQAMQLYALATGDPVHGALAMFIFSIGTVPLMFCFGTVSSLLSMKFTSKLMTVSAVLIIVLGVLMFNTGLSMSGFLGVGTERSDTSGFQPVIVEGYQIVTIEVLPYAYAPITIKNNVPVKFNLHAEERNINGCNNAIIIPEYDIKKEIKPGDNIIEFTPTKTGIIPYSCWMNMIRSSITIVD